MTIEVTGYDHIYLTVSDMGRAESFYDRLMSVLDFRKSAGPLAGGDYHIHYFNRITQISLRPARSGQAFDAYVPGLHHLCLRVPDVRSVEEACRQLRALGLEPTEPKYYPEYAPDYFAIFIDDPDGIRLEITNHREERKEIADNFVRYEKIMPGGSDR